MRTKIDLSVSGILLLASVALWIRAIYQFFAGYQFVFAVNLDRGEHVVILTAVLAVFLEDTVDALKKVIAEMEKR
jgi:hypothetical protein